MTIASRFLNFSASLLYALMSHSEFLSIFIGILKAECIVYPFSSNVDAMPLVAVAITVFSSEYNLFSILLIKVVFPVPPGA